MDDSASKLGNPGPLSSAGFHYRSRYDVSGHQYIQNILSLRIEQSYLHGQPINSIQLLVVPAKLMGNWIQEWKSNVDENAVSLKLLLGYNPHRGLYFRRFSIA